MTAAFVAECDFVRRHRHGRLLPPETRQRALAAVMRMAEAPPEERVSYRRQATEAREVISRQTPVWQALHHLLGARMSKPALERLEFDVLIDRGHEPPLLVEIKTDAGAASVEQGLGQLLLYSALYKRHPDGSDVELVLLLPRHPRPILEEILEEHEITVATYEDASGINFHPDFLARCRYTP